MHALALQSNLQFAYITHRGLLDIVGALLWRTRIWHTIRGLQSEPSPQQNLRQRVLIRHEIPMLTLHVTQLSNYLTLEGSFSAVSKPNFASKYALESFRRDLQNALLCTVLVGSVWVKKHMKIKIEKMKKFGISIIPSRKNVGDF